MPVKKKAASKKKPPLRKKKAKPKKPEREGYHLPVRSEAEQLASLSEDLQDAWKALRAFLVRLGEQQDVRTSHRAIMFARNTCYAFVRPKTKYIELSFFLPRAVDSELIKKVDSVSKTKYVHIVQLVHADQIEEPITDWLRDAFEYSA